MSSSDKKPPDFEREVTVEIETDPSKCDEFIPESEESERVEYASFEDWMAKMRSRADEYDWGTCVDLVQAMVDATEEIRSSRAVRWPDLNVATLAFAHAALVGAIHENPHETPPDILIAAEIIRETMFRMVRETEAALARLKEKGGR